MKPDFTQLLGGKQALASLGKGKANAGKQLNVAIGSAFAKELESAQAPKEQQTPVAPRQLPGFNAQRTHDTNDVAEGHHDFASLGSKEDKAQDGKSSEKKDEKKVRAASTSEEMLLVSRAFSHSARSVQNFDTKHPAVKAERAVVGTEQLSNRVKGATEHHRLDGKQFDAKADARGAKEDTRVEAKKKPVDEKAELEAAKDKDKALETPNAAQATGQPQAPSEPFRIESPQAVKEAAPLAPVIPMMNDDASLRAVILPNVARVSLETGNGERLNIQLKVQDGVTEIRATGPAAQLMEQRQGEIRVALAKEGLALGHFDLTQQDSQQRHQGRPDADDVSPSMARRAAIGASTSSTTVTGDGRVHVKA